MKISHWIWRARIDLVGFFWRLIRYGAVGVAISIVYSASVILLVDGIHFRDATLASVLAFIGVLPASYAAHRYITFGDTASDAFQPLRFAVTTIASFTVATAAMYGVTVVVKSSYLLGIALNWLLIPPTNFLVYFIWVFRVGQRPITTAAIQTDAQEMPNWERQH